MHHNGSNYQKYEKGIRHPIEGIFIINFMTALRLERSGLFNIFPIRWRRCEHRTKIVDAEVEKFLILEVD